MSGLIDLGPFSLNPARLCVCHTRVSLLILGQLAVGWCGREFRVHLRDVELGDVDAYVRMRCDPVMMAELGGPRPREGIQEKVRSDVQDVASGAAWIKMIVPGEDTPDVVAGTVSLWSHETDGEWLSEIGWMVLPEF